ncbi:Uncharacterized protein BW664_03510 [Bacillus mycoides]|nr:Uncharacterized protein BW664_03510 [Bacillus mycoides]
MLCLNQKPEYAQYDIGDYTYSKVGSTIFSWNDETKLKIGKFCSLSTVQQDQ